MFDEPSYTIGQVTGDPNWALGMLNTFLVEVAELRKYLDIDRVRRELNIPEDMPDDYIRDWFGHPDFGRH